MAALDLAWAMLASLKAPASIWPLSAESFPTWTAIVVVLLTAFARCFVFNTANKDHRDEKKRDALLRNLDAILEYVAKKDEDGAEKLGDDDGPDFGPEGMPEASRVMGLLWDEVHDIPTTEYGVPASDERLVRAGALLKRVAEVELRKAVHMTKQASAIAKGQEVMPKNVEDVMAHWSGEKLRQVIDFQQDSLKKHLGPGFVDDAELRRADAYLGQVYKTQGKHMGRLLGLITPLVPTLLMCVVLMMVATLFQSIYHQIGYWMIPVEMAVAGDWEGMRGKLLQIFCGHVVFDVLNTVRSAFQDRACAQLHASVTKGVLKSLLQQDYEYFDRTSPGVLQERLNHDARKLGANLVQFPQEILQMSINVLVALVTVYINVPTDVFLLGICPLGPIVVLQFFVVKFWQRMDAKMRKLDENSAASTGETLREIKTVRQFAMESQECGKFTLNSARSMLLKEQVSTSHRMLGLLFGLSIYGGLVFTVWVGAYRVHAGEMTMAGLVDMTFKLNFNVVRNVRQIIEMLPRATRLMEPLARISELLESSPKIEPAFGDTSGLRPERFRGLIEFDDVHFAYPRDARKRVLKGLTFTVEPGQKVALIGATGCGKSSTMSLLQRLYDPQQGSIRIDGRPLKDYDLRHLRRRIVIVDQFTVLFAGTVRDNLTYGLEDATDEEIEQACRDAVAWDFLQEKPDKLMTTVASGGGNFSGGQKQRIAIARAIVRKPDVILLDEATASLDAENEKLVQQALDKLARKGSALVIAHRLSTIKDSDKIVVLDQGVKVEEGSHDQLLARDDADAELPHSALVPSALRAHSLDEATAFLDALHVGADAQPAGLGRAASMARPPPSSELTVSNCDGEPLAAAPPRPPKLSLSRAQTFNGATVQRGESKGVTYSRLWAASISKQESMTVREMEQKIEKMESELSELKGKVHRIRAHTSSLRSPLVGDTEAAPAPAPALQRKPLKKMSTISHLCSDDSTCDSKAMDATSCGSPTSFGTPTSLSGLA